MSEKTFCKYSDKMECLKITPETAQEALDILGYSKYRCENKEKSGISKYCNITKTGIEYGYESKESKHRTGCFLPFGSYLVLDAKCFMWIGVTPDVFKECYELVEYNGEGKNNDKDLL